VTATGGGGSKPVTLGIDPATTNSACTIGGSLVTFHHPGSCVVAADQAASAGYTAASKATQTIVVPQAAQTISFSLPSSGARTTSQALSATGGGSGNPVTFSVDPTTTNSACSITGATTLHLDHAGACVVDADQAGSGDYAPASRVQHTLTVSKSSQAISFSLPSSGIVGGTQPLSATGGGSGNGVTFSVDGSTSNSACSITGGTTLHLDHAGSCVVVADQSGDGDYDPAQTQQTMAVGKASQAISFSLPGSGTKGGTQALSATGGGSGNAVTFSVDGATTNNACSITGGTTLHLDHAGSCVVDADQAGDGDHTAAPQAQQTVTVGQASQAITFSLPSSGAVGGTQPLTATGGGSGNGVTFSVDGSTSNNACSITGGTTLHLDHVGSCVVDADQAGDGDHTAAPQAQQTVTVGKASQSITFSLPGSGTKDATQPLSATGGGSGQPVTFSVDGATTNNACSISGGTTLHLDHAGSCVVDADQAGDGDHTAAPQAQQTMTVGKASQSITFSLPGSGTKDATQSLSATGGGSGNAVTFSVDATTTNSACSITGGTTLHLDHVGSCVVDADQAGDSDYTAASQAQQTVTVGKASQAISFALPSAGTKDATQSLSATGGGSGNAVTFSIDSSTTNNACSITGGTTLHLDHGGSCVVNADQAGDSDYTAAPQAQQTVTVAKGGTTTAVTVTATALQATVAPVAPAVATPTGTVAFAVDGVTAGTAPLAAGVATLPTSLPPGPHAVTATYGGDSDYAVSSGTAGRKDPTVTVTLSSRHPKSKAGWYRGPVTVTFSCVPGSGSIVRHCPKTRVVRRPTAGLDLSRTVRATDGGTVTVTVPTIRIDLHGPRVAIDLAGARPVCVASDALSGVAGCRIQTRHVGGRTVVVAVATDKAGNVARATRRVPN